MRNVPETVHAYKIPRLNWIFIFFSILFVGAIVWMFWFDYIGYRKWKDYQKEFQTIEAAKLKNNIEADRKAAAKDIAQINLAITNQMTQIAAKESVLQDERKVADIRRVAFENKDTEFKFTKANLDSQKYKHDVAFEELKDHPDSDEAKANYLKEKALLDQMKKQVSDLEGSVQGLEKDYKAKLAEIDKIVGEKVQLEKDLKVRLSKRMLMEKRYQQLTDPVIQNVVNAPMLEIAEPTIRVKQLELEDQRFNVNFAEVPRVDRCISCHVGINRRDPATGEGASEKKHVATDEEIKNGTFRYADLPQPFTAHPNLDLFVGDNSPHPMDKFGCSSCHWGWDRGMDFSRSAHMPDSEKMVKVSFTKNGRTETKEVPQEEEWIEKYNWHEMHHAEQKMRPSSFIESSCLKCHSGQTHYPHAENLDHGVRLIEQAGCFNCHKMRQLETFVTHKVEEGEDIYALARTLSSDPQSIKEVNGLKTDDIKVGMQLEVPVRTLTKTGPNLNKISSKLSKDWVRRWLAEPKRFRPNTFMPQFWGLESTYVQLTNMTDTIKYRGVTDIEVKMPERDAVETDSLAEFLFALSDDPKYPAPPVAGDPGRGKQLVENVGCFACHVINERLEKDAHYTDGSLVDDKKFPLLTLANAKLPSLDEAQYKRSRSQGPMLFGTGSKMDANWLYAWLKNPKQYHPRTKMPNLRLGDQEAADIASYLVTIRNEEFEKKTLPNLNDPRAKEVRDDMVQEYLEGEFPKAEAVDMVKQGRFDAKAADFFRRIKFADVNEFLARWKDSINSINSMSADASDAERRSAKIRVERLAKQMTDLAAERPAVASLLHDWATKLADLATKAATWASLDENVRKEFLSVESATLLAAQAAFEDFAKAQANSLDVETKKKLYVGEKLMGRYGCYSCHNIRGFENAKPIGTELSEWGSKLTDKLDFGYLEDKIEHSNYAYIQQKVKAPRSFDKTDVKKPQEWFKMPQYNLSAEQRKEIAIVVMGMTEEKVLPQARRKLTENEWQVENGRWMVKELNCVGCHVVEKKGGAILATLDPSAKQMWPPNLSGVGTKVKPTWLYHFLQNPGDNKYRYWVNVHMPTFGFSDEQINTLTRYFALLDKQTYPFEGDALQTSYTPPQDMVETGEQIFVTFQCYKCHDVRPAEQAAKASNIGPDLRQLKNRMRPKGVVTWLRDPSKVTPGVNMPANWPTEADGQNPLPKVLNGSTEKQIQAVADYLLKYDGSIEAKYPPAKEEPAATGAGGKTDYE